MQKCTECLPRYFCILILGIYIILYQTWISFIYLLFIILLLTFEIQTQYQSNFQKSASFQVLIVYSNRKIGFILLFIYSFGIMVIKLIFFGLQTEKYRDFVSPGKSFEYFIENDMKTDDILKTLLPSIILAVFSLIVMIITLKKSKITYIDRKKFEKKRKFLKTKIVATRFFLACFLFFLPIVSVSICGIIFYLLFAIFFVRKIIFTNDDDDRLYIETGIKNIICAIFCFNYLVLIPGVEVVNQKFFGFDAFKPEGYSFQV